ncbi:g3656 [Coccomyxa elongata]
MASRPSKWRILAVFGGLDLDAVGENKEPTCGAMHEFTDLAGSSAELLMLRDKTLDEVARQVNVWRPNLVYFSSGASPVTEVGHRTLTALSFKAADGTEVPVRPEELATILDGQEIDAVYFDGFSTSVHAEALREQGVAHVVYWDKSLTPSPKALHVTQFSHAFFATLRNKSATIPEAFALAMHSGHAHCGSNPGPGLRPSWLPELVSDFEPLLPSIDSVPLPVVMGADFKNGVAAAVPGWENVRLLAPHAELRLLVCGESTIIDAHRLSYLGEALRALLVLEVRQLTLASHTPCERVPAHLPANATAVRCSMRSASNAHATVVLGGPPQVLGHDSLVEYALRQTLVADALSLQFRLPPQGIPAPTARKSAAIANGADVVDALVVTSVWAVHLLRTLSGYTSFRGLVALGLGGIGSARVAGFNSTDAARYIALAQAYDKPESLKAAGNMPAALPGGKPSTGPSAPSGPASYPTMLAPKHPDAAKESAAQPNGANYHSEPTNGRAADAKAAGKAGQEDSAAAAKKRKLAQASTTATPVWRSKRPRMWECTEAQFMEDLCAFHRERNHKNVTPENFPDAILNGSRLDLYNLYKEVTSRGGIKVGNGINWKGQVFPKMNNFTAHNRMTGVGNALKRHYTMYLLEYEQAHPEDIRQDKCEICNGSDESATDWISCDQCNKWVHFSCDRRPNMGSFKDYAKGNGATYICVNCSNAK